METTSQNRLTVIDVPMQEVHRSFADSVREGLSSSPRTLPCRFLYDEEGSKIFEEICELPEYYLTRTELGLLEASADSILDEAPEDASIVELGSGSSTKTRVLLEAGLRRNGALHYVPIDISHTMLQTSAEALLKDYEGLEILGVAGEYQAGLEWLAAESSRPKLVLWLGSSIGNLNQDEAAAFLADVRKPLNPESRLLLGTDLKKSPEILQRAYDDSAGVTARFNTNLLERINQELGANFRIEDFEHAPRWEEENGRMASYLRSKREQTVVIEKLGMTVTFAAGERIWTESSHKYSPETIEALTQAAGFRSVHRWNSEKYPYQLTMLAPA